MELPYEKGVHPEPLVKASRAYMRAAAGGAIPHDRKGQCSFLFMLQLFPQSWSAVAQECDDLLFEHIAEQERKLLEAPPALLELERRIDELQQQRIELVRLMLQQDLPDYSEESEDVFLAAFRIEDFNEERNSVPLFEIEDAEINAN